MKKTIKFLSLVLALTMTLLAMSVVVLAEDASNFTVTFQAENYATVVMYDTIWHSTTGRGLPSCGKTAFINNVPSENILVHYAGQVATFKVPHKELLSSIVYNNKDSLAQQFSTTASAGKYFNIFGTMTGFPFSSLTNGIYKYTAETDADGNPVELDDSAVAANTTYKSAYDYVNTYFAKKHLVILQVFRLLRE